MIYSWRAALMATLLATPLAALAQDCTKTGVAAFKVTAPNGASSLLIGSMHSPFDGLCEPAASAFDGATLYVVESVGSRELGPDALGAPAAVALRKPVFPPVLAPGTVDVSEAARKPWAAQLAKDQVDELRRRAECSGFPRWLADLTLTMESAASAASLAIQPCAKVAKQSRDDLLAQAAIKHNLETRGLETQTEVSGQRRKVREEVHRHMLKQALTSEPERTREQVVRALNLGHYDELLSLVIGLAETRQAGEDYAKAMLTERNLAWMPRLTRYLDQGHAVVNVGAAHLGGPSGLPALLRARGYRLEAIGLPALTAPAS